MRIKLAFYSKLKKVFTDMSIMRKLTLVYTMAILVPTMSMGLFTYTQSIDSIKKEIAQSTYKNMLQIKADIDRKISIIRGISNNIAYNDKIQYFLYYGIDFTADALNNYIDSVSVPVPVNYALNFSEVTIHDICVYFTESKMPEYGPFLSEERIKNTEWYNDFMSSNDQELWLYPELQGNKSVIKYIKKIISIDRKYLGIIIIDILASDMFSALDINVENQAAYIIDEKNRIIYPVTVEDKLMYTELLGNNIGGEEGFFYHNNTLFNYQTIEPLKIKLLISTSVDGFIKSVSFSVIYNILVVVLGVIMLEIFIFFLLKVIFSRLNQIVKVMEVVTNGNFNIRIPVFQHDEIGQIAENFNILIKKINDLVNDMAKKETSQKEAQLAALQYQINPHFIYNTIDTFRMQLELEGNYEVANAITYFARILRYNLSSNSKFASLKDEIDYINKYIALQKFRYKDLLNFEIDLPQELEDIKILRFMLQPIIENSIKHGLKESGETLTIRISFRCIDKDVEVTIRDNGRGLNRKQLNRIRAQLSAYDEKDSTNGSGIGLMNINRRLRLFYGERYHVHIDSVEGEYTEIKITIPYMI